VCVCSDLAHVSVEPVRAPWARRDPQAHELSVERVGAKEDERAGAGEHERVRLAHGAVDVWIVYVVWIGGSERRGLYARGECHAVAPEGVPDRVRGAAAAPSATQAYGRAVVGSRSEDHGAEREKAHGGWGCKVPIGMTSAKRKENMLYHRSALTCASTCLPITLAFTVT
jgi:hypothetical protein